VVDLVARHDIAEAYGRQRDEAEVRTVQQIPILPFGEQNRAAPDVPVGSKSEGKPRQSRIVLPALFSISREL
jgi:hypothetical protein